MTALPRISVVIATYSRARLLDECLQHLAAQRFMPGDEVVVVDNGSPDETPDVVNTHVTRFAVPLRLRHESQAGKSHALARGIATATGEVLAFVDDDVNVDGNWLDVVRETMRDGSIALMGGRVVPRWDAGVAEWLRTAPARHARLGAPLGLLEYPHDVVQLGARTVLGANMAVRRDVLAAVGGFATHLGKLRGTLLSGEDHELCMRVQAAGFRAVYVPAAVVHHWVPAERARVGYFVHWFYWSGITNAILDAETAHPGGRTVRGLPFYVARRAAVATFAALKALLGGRRDTALHHATDVAFAAGYAAKRWGIQA
jgi:GT2 family glycosyltransferase